MNILVEAGIFGVVSTDDNAEYGYYVYIYIFTLHTQCKLKISLMDIL